MAGCNRRNRIKQDGRKTMARRRGVTILELLVVLFVVGLLATVAYSVYSAHVLHAQIAATATDIHALEMACAQYEIDTGQYPPSSSGTRLAPGAIDPSNVPREGAIGCGYMMVALLYSLSGDMYNPIDARWKGPYTEIQRSRLGTLTGEPIDLTQTYVSPQLQLLDRWGNPYYYVRSADYQSFIGTQIPANHPFANEKWYNPTTVQIVSKGPNGVSLARPETGLDYDDITNFRY